MLLLAVALMVWACIILIDKRPPEAAVPVASVSIDSVKGTLPSDSMAENRGDAKRQTGSKKGKQGKGASKKNKASKSKGQRDHLREPIPQED